jgi:hypothetical protein
MGADVVAEIERIVESLASGSEPLAARFESATKLQHYLYENCFCHRFGSAAREAVAAGSLLDELSRANAGRDLWDRGWQIAELLPAGCIRAAKDHFTRTFWPGEFVSFEGPGVAPRAGVQVTAFFPRESTGTQAGYYFAFGNTAEEDLEDNGLIRFYWAVDSGGAVPLMRAVTERLNRFQVPFRLKMPVDRSFYQRLDAAVLYVHKRFYQICARLIVPIHANIREHLSAGVPLFSKPFAEGVGLAEDTGIQESFGMNRCRILAEGIWNADREGGLARAAGSDAGIEKIAGHFALQGLDLARPYLNPGSADQYQIPEGAESQ